MLEGSDNIGDSGIIYMFGVLYCFLISVYFPY